MFKIKELTFLKKALRNITISILILLLSFGTVVASTQGRLFLEVEKSGDVCLNKMHEKNIRGENIKKAVLNSNGREINILDTLRKNIEAGHILLKLDPENKAFIEVHYIFNKPPTISSLQPIDGFSTQENNVVFEWEALDTDGTFLEYMVEIDGDIEYATTWMSQNKYALNLEGGKYFWKVWARDNSFLNNVTVSNTHFLNITNFTKKLEKPKILFPPNNLLTKAKKINISILADIGANNQVFLNENLLKETDSRNIIVETLIEKEGENKITVISKRGNEQTEEMVVIKTKWTPPTEPNFELKLEGKNILLKIQNDDYNKGYIFFKEKVLKEIERRENWIDLGDKLHGEIKIGVMLEDEVGNRTEIVYKTLDIDEDILGIGGSSFTLRVPNPSYCTYRYNRTRRRFEGRHCFITTPEIVNIQNFTKDGKTFSTTIAGVYNPNMVILVDETECTIPVICAPKIVRTRRMQVKPKTTINFYLNDKLTQVNGIKKSENGYFFSMLLLTNTNLQGRIAHLRYETSYSFTHDKHWIDIYQKSQPSYSRIIPVLRRLPNKDSNRIFRFPFSRIIGVTQWHGFTAFQSPHTGIDFGSYREPIYAIGDGTVRSVGWDNYYGKCLSGGYFMRIEHDNGMNSVYMHLENYKKTNGRNWNAGERIGKGELLGISGNSGAYNCQPLGYHLHFELRRLSPQSTHINPVPYLDVNWNNVNTINHRNIPGRLTGDNPHPTW